MSYQDLTNPDILDSRSEVARRIGCSPKTIQRAERRGEIVPIRFNARLVRYRRSDVDTWIANARALSAIPPQPSLN